MQVDLSTEVEQRLAQHAKAAGYDDVLRYVAEQLESFAHQPTPDELPPLSKEELVKSLALIEEGESDLSAGRKRDMREALLDIGERMGFRLGAIANF